MDSSRNIRLCVALSLLFLAGGDPLSGDALRITELISNETRSVVSIFDVGQGSCALISYNHVNVMVDCGSSAGGETQTRVRLLLLKLMDSKIVQTVYVSHADKDHLNWIHKVLKSPLVENLVLGGRRKDYNGTTLKEWWEGKSLNPEYLMPNAHDEPGNPREQFGEGTPMGDGIYVLTATNGATEKGKDRGRNADSAVLMFVHGEFKVILPGDATLISEKEIYENNKDNFDFIRSTVLVASHHGAAPESNGFVFAGDVRPEFVIYSAHKMDSYKHPRCDARRFFDGAEGQRITDGLLEHKFTCSTGTQRIQDIWSTVDIISGHISTHDSGSIFIVSDGNQRTIYSCKSLKMNKASDQIKDCIQLYPVVNSGAGGVS